MFELKAKERDSGMSKRNAWMKAGAGAVVGALLAGCGSLDSSKTVAPREDLKALRITEVHYHPTDVGIIPGDEYEFIEVKNTGSKTLELDDVGFTDGIAYTFPKGTTLEAGKFLLVAAYPDRIQVRYGAKSLGPWEGQLSNSGETLVLEDLPANTPIDSLTYSDEDGWPGAADGSGPSLVPKSPSDLSRPWRASFKADGSPGKDDIVAALITELSSHTDPPDRDAIEIHNPSDSPLDIGGWYLSDEEDEPAKFRIPAGTTIPAKGYFTFYDNDFNKDSAAAGSFNLSAHGEEAWIFSHAGGCDSGYCHGVEFGEVENGLTFGRHVTSDGTEFFPVQARATLGVANAGPRAWPVVISEVMYHSANDSDDFLEVVNAGTDSVQLFDPLRPANTWKIEGLGFRFPTGVTLAKGEFALVVPVRADTGRIRTVYSVPAAVRIFKAEGELSNSGDSLALAKPEDPYLKNGAAPGDSTVPYMIMDQVYYRDGGPWPGAADGAGQSLQRKSLQAFGSEPENWSDALPTAGR
jgi:hypothetical protein